MTDKKVLEHKVGETLEVYAMIKNVELKTTKTNSNYIRLTIMDKSGELTGNLWDATPGMEDQYPSGKIILLKGKLGEYNGNKQIENMAITFIDDNDPMNDRGLYIKTAPLSSKELHQKFTYYIEQIEDNEIRNIVTYILNKYRDKLFSHPAAKMMHHAFHGGLAYHTISMLNTVESIANFYPKLNKSLLYAGTILHDICKINEMAPIEEGSEYTLKGAMIGHIVMIDNEITQAAAAHEILVDSEKVILLRNIVLSHHHDGDGRDWGSPQKAQIPEGYVLHYVDMIDARMNQISEALEPVEEGQFVKVFGLGNIYKSHKF